MAAFLPPNSYPSPKATALQVTIHSARELISTEIIGRSSPYVKVKLDQTEHVTEKKKGRHPVWEQSFNLTYKEEAKLTFQVWDKDILFDDYMGVNDLPLQQILQLPERKFTGEIPLTHRKGKKAGHLKVTLHFYPDRPAAAAPTAAPQQIAAPPPAAPAPGSPYPATASPYPTGGSPYPTGGSPYPTSPVPPVQAAPVYQQAPPPQYYPQQPPQQYYPQQPAYQYPPQAPQGYYAAPAPYPPQQQPQQGATVVVVAGQPNPYAAGYPPQPAMGAYPPPYGAYPPR